MSVPTAKLIQTLQELAQAASGFRKTAFSKAVEAVKKHKKATITKAELVAYQGIGEGILRRFDELVSSGGLAELKEHEEERKVVELFEGIYGVGPVLAKKWFQQGSRTLKDIPVETLTRSQSLGLKYYKDINSRIPRHEIDQINRELSRVVSAFNSKHKLNIRAKICGSYLRGRESSGDIDIIISDELDRPFIDAFLKDSIGLFHHILAKGDSKVLTLGGLGQIERRIDLELVEREDWAYALLYFTGSANFNKHMRGIAKDKGYLLNHAGLFMGDAKVSAETERDIFDFLDMKYLTPEERDKW